MAIDHVTQLCYNGVIVTAGSVIVYKIGTVGIWLFVQNVMCCVPK